MPESHAESPTESESETGFTINVELETLPYSNLIEFGQRLSFFRQEHPTVKLCWYEADEQIKSEDDHGYLAVLERVGLTDASKAAQLEHAGLIPAGKGEENEDEEDDRENDPNWYVVTLEFQSQADLGFFKANFWERRS